MTSIYRNNWLPEIFNDFFDSVNFPKTSATAPAINVKETENEYVVEVGAPGLTKEDFNVHINNDGNLTIKVENHNEQKDDKSHYLRREFYYSKYEQTLLLPDDVDKEHIAAKVADGILTVELPKVKKEEQKVSRQIAIG